jgi:hypothetical protein
MPCVCCRTVRRIALRRGSRQARHQLIGDALVEEGGAADHTTGTRCAAVVGLIGRRSLLGQQHCMP